MLQFVLGRSGFGKTEYLRDLIADKARGGEDKLLFLVPDQITFENETAFLDLLGPADAGRVLVLGFSRLSDYVFEKTGNRFSTFADEGIRNLVMSLALEQVADRLTIFEKRSASRDLCEVMLSAVKEYKKCSLSSDVLRSAAEAVEDETLSKKLTDSALVYDAYNAIMEQSYMDPLDSLTKVSELLLSHPLFEGYTIAVDSFYGFTAQEYGVMERLMTQSREMYVALTDDGGAGGDTSLFYAPQRTRANLSRIARNNHIVIKPHIRLTEPHRFLDPALAAVEENLYRLDKTPYADACDAVSVYEASGVYDECDYVARTIRKLIEDGYRYRDIAVIARATDPYAGILDACFEKYNIRYFMDDPVNIDAMPIVRLVSSAFDIVCRSFDRDDVLTLLKTGLCSYDLQDIADFENYLYVWDISGRRFFDAFTANPSGYSDTFSDDEKEQLARVEALRKDVIGKLRRFAKAVRDTDGRTIAKALMDLLYALKCDENIDRLCSEMEQRGEDDLSADLLRMWGVMCELLDKTVAVIGDYAIEPKRFSELLYVNFSNTEVASIPRGLDEVDVACADRSLVSGKRAVFVIGANEGEFPRTPVEAGVFTDAERCVLKSMSLPLSDSVGELFSTERYYAYTALTSASEKLYISYYTADLVGEKRAPSDIVTELKTALTLLQVSTFDTVPITDRLLSERAAFDYLIAHYRSRSSDTEALRAYFKDHETYAPLTAAIDKLSDRHIRRITQRDLTRKLFGSEMRLSSTRIEAYHNCAFRYFCEYGLKTKERRKAEMNALEYGTMIHYVFESFFGRHDHAAFSGMTETDVAEEVSALLDGYFETHFGGEKDKSKRFLYLFYRIKSTAVKLVWRLIEEFAQSDFTPVDFELGIGDDIPAYTLDLENGLSLSVRGSVDRVDLCDLDGVRYVRVVDYKTGTKTFDLSDIYYGINLQMFLYLSAIERGAGERYGDDLTPAGVLYMPAVSPSVSADGTADEKEVRKKILEKYTMKGLILDDESVLTAMEHDGRGVYIPVKFNGEKITAGAGSLATIEELGAIFRRIDVLVSQMAMALYDGNVDAAPLLGDYDACKYCRYRSVCLRDDNAPYRDGKHMSKAELFAQLCGKGDDDGESENMDG